MLTVSFPLRAKTMNFALYEGRQISPKEEGHNLYQWECRLSDKKLVLQKKTHEKLSTRNTGILMKSFLE